MRRILCYIGVCLGVFVVICSCKRTYFPKPYAYYRIAIPDTSYIPLDSLAKGERYPFTFLVSVNAEISHSQNMEKYWFNIHYPGLNTDIHCSYKSIQNNLKELNDDAVNFVYKHISHASAIPEREFSNSYAKVHGVLFSLMGNTASPYQFFLTDSTRHFFRGAVYCNCHPNQDSLLPVHQYIEKDVVRLVESFQWKNRFQGYSVKSKG